MKIRKIILCIAAGLTTFGASVGLFELGRWLTVEPVDEYCQTVNAAPTNVKPVEPVLTADNLPSSVTVSTPSVAPVALPETKPADDEVDDDEYAVHNGGDFYIIGELPKGFEDIESLSFWTTDYSLATAENNYREIRIAPKGFIETNRQLDFTRVSVNRKRLMFETETVRGISYKFNGEFIDREIKMTEYTAYAVLEGTLTKIRDGKTIAETEVKFGIGGC